MRTPNLYTGEYILVKSGIHWKNYIIPLLEFYFMAALLIVRIHYYGVPLMEFLQRKIPTGYFRMLSFIEVVIILLVIARLIVRMIKISKIGYFITNKRIMKLSGWMTVNTNEMMLDRCETVELKKNLYERLYGTGDLLILSAGASIVFDDIPKADKFKQTIQEILMERDTKPEPSIPENKENKYEKRFIE